MKFSILALFIAISLPATSFGYRLLEAQKPVETVVIEREIPWEDENPDLDVMIPEEKYVVPPKNIVQEVIEVEAEPVPEPEPEIIAVVALTPEMFEKLQIEKRVVEVENVGASQSG